MSSRPQIRLLSGSSRTRLTTRYQVARCKSFSRSHRHGGARASPYSRIDAQSHFGGKRRPPHHGSVRGLTQWSKPLIANCRTNGFGTKRSFSTSWVAEVPRGRDREAEPQRRSTRGNPDYRRPAE